MPKNICFVYTDTNGLHKTDEFISKKNMYEFARPVCLNYIIGYKQGKEFIEVVKERRIFKPEYISIPKDISDIHGITYEKAEKKGENGTDILSKFVKDLKNVDVIVSHNLPFHLKAIQNESIRRCISPDYSKFILIDTISFSHDFKYPKLKELAEKILKKDYSDKKQSYNIQIIKKCFLKLYEKYEKSILSSKESVQKSDSK